MKHAPDWRIWLGLGLTGAWLMLGAFYISAMIGWDRFAFLPANDLGSFLEGAFAPLAFLWLVIGYFLQKKELEQNTAALKAQADEIQRTAEQAVIQSEKMAASEMHARLDTFLQLSNHVRRSLGLIGGFLYLSSQGGGAGGLVPPEEIARLFTLQSNQDPEVFSRRLLETHVQMGDPDAQFALFYGSPIRARHSNNFIFNFERLLQRCEGLDGDGMLRDALLTSGHGLIYGIMKRHQSIAPPELADPSHTGTYVSF
ncbi:MAG: hypothetical protein R3E86_10085 [Pseudomonadales bacterium]